MVIGSRQHKDRRDAPCRPKHFPEPGRCQFVMQNGNRSRDNCRSSVNLPLRKNRQAVKNVVHQLPQINEAAYAIITIKPPTDSSTIGTHSHGPTNPLYESGIRTPVAVIRSSSCSSLSSSSSAFGFLEITAHSPPAGKSDSHGIKRACGPGIRATVRMDHIGRVSPIATPINTKTARRFPPPHKVNAGRNYEFRNQISEASTEWQSTPDHVDQPSICLATNRQPP